MAEPDSHSLEVWHDLNLHFHGLMKARLRFFAKDVDRVALIRFALEKVHVSTVMYIAPSLNELERQQLFPEWLENASCLHGYALAARDVILSLPREWVIANVEELAEPFLQDGTEDEYRRMLELYRALGAKDLVEKLARRATKHQDWEVREAGQDFLDAL